ncbi:Kunitz inhibitor ST1-like protein [Cynara cardunculus var. scolymus]|uniref:Kunitz inhibitor ST1-like protein n=1 Tax=Cynara cardunculus var. scolymus TaxID=59895 RepID=A0A124SDM9_CYNCS|nr:Kunitz inhibitor ST1-like protein [Cynara cardunculus var. scolymus]
MLTDIVSFIHYNHKMKFNILVQTLLCTLLSSFYPSSTQPLKTIVNTTPTSTSTGMTAFDIDGHEVQPGIKYYINPVQSNSSGGGGLSLASRDGFCPPFVVQENNQLSKGLPLRFLPLDTKQNAITLSGDLNIVFNAATICVQSTVWRISSGGSNIDDTLTRRRYYVRSGGMVGKPGVGTINNWFRIEKVGAIGCKVVCGDIGILEENGKKWLALDDQPFAFMFKRA